MVYIASRRLEQRELKVGRSVYSLAWSADGRRLAVGSSDNRIRVFENGDPTRESIALVGHQQMPVALEFHPDGRQLVSSSWDTTTRLWNLGDGRTLAEFPEWGWDLKFDASGSRLSSYDAETGVIRVHRVKGRPLCRDLLAGAQRPVHQLVFSPSNNWVSVVSEDSWRFIELAGGTEIARLPGRRLGVGWLGGHRALATVETDRILAWTTGIGARGGWVVQSGQVMGKVAGRAAILAGRDGSGLGVFEPGVGLSIWSPTGAPPRLILKHPLPRRMAISADGRRLGAIGYDSPGEVVPKAVVWDTDSGERIWSLPTEPKGGLGLNASGCRLFLTSASGLSCWDLNTNAVVWQDRRLESHPGDQVCCSPDGRLLAVTVARKTLGLYDAATGEFLMTLEHPSPQLIRTLDFSPDSTRLAVGCETGWVQLWDLQLVREELAAMGLDWGHPPCRREVFRDSTGLQVEIRQPDQALP